MQLVSKQARTRNTVAVITKIGGAGTLCLLGAGLMGSRAVAADTPIALVPSAGTLAPQTSPLISLDFTRAAVSDILTMIGREGNVDIIIGEDVTGTLKSVHLTDKTADQAIRMVAQSSGIAWKKLDARTYMVGQAAGSSTQSAPTFGTDPSQENMAVPDSSGSSGLEVPLLVKPQSKSADESSTMTAVDLRNVKPTIMAYWLDPAHQPKPVQFQKSDERAKYEGDRFKGIKAMAPSKLMQREDVGDVADISSPQTPAWAQPGSGYLPFNPYTQSSRQTGGNTGGGGGGGGGAGGGGAGGGSGSSNQDIPASAAATVALPQGVDNIIAIDAQNVLLVRGTDEGLDRIREIIGVLDRPIPQVEIETRFVQILTNDINRLGISFTRAPISSPNTTTNGTGIVGDPLGAGISISYTSGRISANLDAAITSGRVKVVSAPRVTTFNNLTAQVVSINTITTQITDSILVPNGANGTITVPRTTFFSQVSGVVLTVIPTVNRDGTITMSLQPLVLTPSPPTVAGSLFNDISSQEINTSANIKDGDTLAIGGLRTLTQTNQRGKIPLLGDLPIIGPLFRSRNKQDIELELVIFVTAHIVPRINDPVAGT